jgi:hypothetical protein
MSPEAVVDEVLRWSAAFIEAPHPIFGGLPVCPFARAARLRGSIRFEVLPFDVDDALAPASDVMRLVADFARDEAGGGRETLFVVHPDRNAMAPEALERFVARLDARLRATEGLTGFVVFEAHPGSGFEVGGVHTRRGPYPSFQVLSHARLKTTSDALLGSEYYSRFTPDMLRAVGMPR